MTHYVLDLGIPMGPAGANGTSNSTIIPLSSGGYVLLDVLLGGIFGSGVIIGSSTATTGIAQFGGSFDLANGGARLLNLCCVMPRNGTISALQVDFLAMTGTNLGIGTTSAYAQIYIAPISSTVFAPQGSPLVLSPGVISLTVATHMVGGQSLSIPVNTGDRIMLLMAANNSGGLLTAGTIQGYASAGIAIT